MKNTFLCACMDKRCVYHCFMLFLCLFFGMLDLLESGTSVFSPWREHLVLSGLRNAWSHFEKCFSSSSSFFFYKSKQEKNRQVWNEELAWKQLWSFLSGGICVSSSFGLWCCARDLVGWQFGRKADERREHRRPGRKRRRSGGTLWFCDRYRSTSGSWRAPPGWESLASTPVKLPLSATDKPVLDRAEQSAVFLAVVTVLHSASVSPFSYTTVEKLL